MLFILALLAAAQERVAVLEFDASKAGSDIDRTYFSDLVRGAVHKAAPDLFVMTRESTVQLLKASGKKLENCEGECEVETGKLLGADYVVSGRITKVGTRYSLTLRLHATATGELLNTAEARGKSLDELVDNAGAASSELVQPVKRNPRAPAAVQEPAAPQPEKAPSDCSSPDDCLEKAAALAPKGDWPRLAVLYKRACDGGLAEGCTKLADLHYQGRGVPKNADKGDELWERACDLKSAWACLSVGKRKMAEGVRNASGAYFPIAVGYFRRACDAGYRDSLKACEEVASIGSDQYGHRSYQEALPLLKLTCDSNIGGSCFDLANMYRQGTGVPEDADLSKKLYGRACELGVQYGSCESAK